MTIAANSTITQSGYHYILNTLRTILSTASTGYGVLPVSDYIGTGTLIRSEEWNRLYEDLNRVYHHQNGTATDIISTVTYPIESGKPLKRNFVNSLVSSVDTLAANKYTVDQSQLVSNSTSSFSGTSTFTYVLTSTVVYEWPDESSLDWYFNLGGYIQTDLVAPVPTTYYDDQHRLVVGLVNNFRNTINQPFNRTALQATKSAPGQKIKVSSTASTSTGVFTAIFTVSNTYEIVNSIFSSGIKVTTEIEPTTVAPLVPMFNLTATVTVTNYVSTGAIQAIVPERSYTRDFDDFVTSTNVRRTVTLEVTPRNLYYSMTGGSTSTTQQITINNLAVDITSNPATITSIQAGSNVVTPYFSHGNLPITIAPGASATVGLYWDKPTITFRELGEHSNPVVIKSNNTRGDIVIPTRIFVQEPAGDWAFSPSSTSTNLTTYKKLTQNIRIVPVFSKIRRIVSINLAQSGNNFSLVKRPNAADPNAIITYEPNDPSAGTFTGTLTVTAEVSDTTGDFIQTTKTFIFTVNQNLVDSNLGSWVSPFGPINGVIGTSYDIIGGQRYLTVGVGIGADGSPTLDNAGSALSKYINVNYLGINNNSLIASNYAFRQYSSSDTEFAGFGQFLKDYGVKSSQTYIGPNDTACTYDIEIPATGNYTVRYSVYESGYIEIDGNRLINLSAYTQSNYQTVSSAVINLTAGTHTIRFVGNLRMALTITGADNSLVWSTLNIIQTGTSYRYWYEVYRFPINMDGKFKLFKSKDYRVKDTAAVQSTATKKYYPYGDFFGLNKDDWGSIFEVRSNGFGQVTVSVMPPIQQGIAGDTITVGSLYFAFYYFAKSIPRYTHKTGGNFDGDPTYTDYFLGFDKFGNIRTDKRLIPTSFNYTGKNSIIDQIITFFLSSFITDAIVIELGLFTSKFWGYNVSLGARLLEQFGIDLAGSKTVGGYIVEYFDSFFTSGTNLPSAALEILKGISDTVSAIGQTISYAAKTALEGVQAIYAPLAAIGSDAAMLYNAFYVGSQEAAAAYAAGFSSNITAVLTETIGVGGTVFIINAAGVLLTVDGINRIARGIKEGDVGAIAVGALETYAGYTLAQTVFQAAITFIASVSCFSGETPIELADGTTKPIKDIAIGDLVMNHDRTMINKVRMIQISDSKGFANTLWSPDPEIKPFATLNHPVYINGKLSAAAPEVAMNYQPWIGEVIKAEDAKISKTENQKVYNIYPDGDATFRVYHWGAPSLSDGDTTTFRMYEQGVITFEEVQELLNGIISESEKYGPNVIYGGVILDRAMRKINSDLLMKYAIKFWLLKNPLLRSAIFRFITLVGASAQLAKKKQLKDKSK